MLSNAEETRGRSPWITCLLILIVLLIACPAGAMTGGWLGASAAAAITPIFMTVLLVNVYNPYPSSKGLYGIMSLGAAMPVALSVVLGGYIGCLARGGHWNSSLTSFSREDWTVAGFTGAAFGILCALLMLSKAFPASRRKPL